MATPHSDLAVDLRGVRKHYRGKAGGVVALSDVNLQIQHGAAFGLLGPNGAGKSTLVKIMMTLVRPNAAAGTILGQPLGNKPTLQRIGYLPEHHRFPRYLTGRQTLEFFGALLNMDRPSRQRRAAELLDIVGMKDASERKVSTYSKGMMQRVGLAQALINDPDLIVLDEPTDGVDVQGRRDVRDVLLRLKSQGKTVLLNSHLLSELDLVCDRVAILVKGQVVKQGTIKDLTMDRQRFEIEVAPEDTPALKAAANVPLDPAGRGTYPGNIPLEITPGILKILTTDPALIQPLIDRLRAAGTTIRRIQPIRQSLEELFIETVEGAPGQSRPVPRAFPVGARP